MFPADTGDLRKGIDHARADRPCGADDEKRLMAEPPIGFDLTTEDIGVHPLLIVGGDPADGVGTEPKEIGGFLDPRVGFGRGIDEQLPPVARQPFLSHVPRRLRRAGRDDADEVGHVAAADQQAAAARRIANQLGNPADSLPFDLGRERRQPRGSNVLVQSGCQKIAEHPDRRRAGSDIAEKARMSVEERMVEEQRGRFAHQPRGAGAGRRKRPLRPERPPEIRRRLVMHDGSIRQLRQAIGDLVDEAMTDLPELLRRHLEWRLPLPQRLELRHIAHRNPSNRSDSCARPPLTML